MPMTGFICQDTYLAKCAKLSDQEVGRLFRALMQYHSSGIAPELAGRESIAFDFIRDDIDRADKAYDEKCETNKKNRQRTITTVNDRQRPSTNQDERDQNNNNNKKEREVKEKTNNHDDNSAGAWVTDSEVHESLERDNKIVNAALTWGLPAKEGHMIKARDLAQGYSLEWLLRAIEIAGNGKEQTWRYVEGILRSWKENGGPDAPRKQQNKPAKTVGAQQYTQRDYTEDELGGGIDADLVAEARRIRGTA